MSWDVLIASVTVIFSVISYVLSRRRELAWKRTEFLCSQSQYLDDDPVLVEVVTILEGRHPTITATDIFDGKSVDPGKQREYQQKFDKLLNFLWRICYAYETLRTISDTEVEGFGAYFWRISKIPVVVDYCEHNGFAEINAVTRKLKLDEDD
jgi:hypothetical protein